MTKPYEKGDIWVTKYDETIKDTYGNKYVHSAVLSSCGYQEHDFGRLTYLLNGKYNHLDMTIAYDVDSDRTYCSGYIQITVDGEIIYTSPEITSNTKPVHVSLDLEKDANM